MSVPESPTAAMVVIGDEILSGRTQDINLNYLARFLATHGIDLREARIVPDIETRIVDAVNTLRKAYDYVFTTGGIGPTHDDITAEAIAKAFGVSIDYNEEAAALIAARYKPGEFNSMRKRMARIPNGASLIQNPVSGAPGFQMQNVFVMAGIPMIARAMLEDVAPRLRRGAPVHVCTVTAQVPEGEIAEAIAKIQADYPSITIGSYPFFQENRLGVQLVVRGRDCGEVATAADSIELALRTQGILSKRENQ